jgi:hypothetical protein
VLVALFKNLIESNRGDNQVQRLLMEVGMEERNLMRS